MAYWFLRCNIYHIHPPRASHHRKTICHMSRDFVWLAEQGEGKGLLRINTLQIYISGLATIIDI